MVSFPPNVNSASFSKVCAKISAELVALENEQHLARLADPRYRAFLAGLFRISLSAEDDPDNERERAHFFDLVASSVKSDAGGLVIRCDRGNAVSSCLVLHGLS